MLGQKGSFAFFVTLQSGLKSTLFPSGLTPLWEVISPENYNVDATQLALWTSGPTGFCTLVSEIEVGGTELLKIDWQLFFL